MYALTFFGIALPWCTREVSSMTPALLVSASLIQPCPEATAPPAIGVRIHNEALVQEDVLETALGRASGVFRRAGIIIEWTMGEPSARGATPLFDLVLATTSPRLAAAAAASHPVLGHANQPAGRAYAYYDIIRDAAVMFRTAREYLLGDVVAHELGHLLLPASSHSAWGIMRPDAINRGLSRSFMQREADAIVETVRAHGGRRAADCSSSIHGSSSSEDW
jgi:hypothetical protein